MGQKYRRKGLSCFRDSDEYILEWLVQTEVEIAS